MNRNSPTRLAALGACASALLLGACAQLLGIDDLSGPPGADAGPSSFTVSGVAAGLLQPVSIRLEHPGGSEPLRIEADGPFAFDTVLARGDTYEVVFEDAPPPPCVLWNASGTLSNQLPVVELACEPVLLSRLLMEDPGAPAIAFEPGRSRYDVSVSALRQSVRVTAATVSPDATLTVAGVPLASGATSAPLPLDFGDNPIEIEVRHPGGVERTYQLTLRRGAPPAQDAYAKPSNTGAGDEFGYTMAMSGDTLVVGAPYEDSDATGVNGNPNEGSPESGAAYVFRRSGDTWVQEAYLKPSGTTAGVNFGQSVAISGDVIAVGAPYQDEGAVDTGTVYVFRRTDSGWAQDASLTASNRGAGDNFGWAVALSEDALAVGARAEDSSATGVDGNPDDEGTTDSGAVYVFRYGGGGWTEDAYIKASNPGVEDNFGRTLALVGDTLAVGVFLEDSPASGVNGDQGDAAGTVNSGAVYVFRRSGGTWAQEAYIKASNPGFNDNFGIQLALDEDVLAVGAPYEDSGATGVGGSQSNDGSEDSGAVYVFRRSGSAWAQEAYIKASNTNPGDNFGWSPALVGDTLVVGAIGESSAAKGAQGDENDNTTVNSGAAYIFGRSGGTWVQNSYLKASNTAEEDWFGYKIALSEHALAVTARFEDSSASGVGGSQDSDSAGNSGALYLFY